MNLRPKWVVKKVESLTLLFSKWIRLYLFVLVENVEKIGNLENRKKIYKFPP